MNFLKSTNRKPQTANRQRGFALVVTLILSTVMLTVVTIASKEMVDEMRNSARLDNSLIAYYAAEAGVEDALLQLRYEKNKEIIPICKKVEDYETVNINNCQPNTFGKTHYYKLKVSSATNTTDPIKIYKDDTYEIPISGNTVNSLTLKWKNKDLGGSSRIRLEAVVYKEDGEILDKKLSDPAGTSGNPSLTLNNITTGPSKKIVRIKPWHTGSDGAAGAAPSITMVPYIELEPPTGVGIGSSTTTIESTGYYGNVARKITAKIDSTTGSILNIFDFTIYSDTPLLK